MPHNYVMHCYKISAGEELSPFVIPSYIRCTRRLFLYKPER